MSGHHPATVRGGLWAQRKRGARFESSEALAEQPVVVRGAVELHIDAAPGCRSLVARCGARPTTY